MRFSPPRIWERYGALLLIFLAVACFTIFPATMCFDCETDDTWGRSKEINDLGWKIFETWLLAAPFLASSLRCEYAWIVPIAITLANIGTQHLGGAPWWSIRNNEGPVTLIIALPVGLVSLAAGYVCRYLCSRFLARQPSSG